MKQNDYTSLQKLLITICAAALVSSNSGCIRFHCGEMKGEFAFRLPMDNRYRLYDTVPEFRNDMKIDWSFIFKKNYGKKNIGVVISKKETVWVDVQSWPDDISETKRILYGTIEGFKTGTYKISITGENGIIAEKEFIVYSEDKDLEEDE